MVKDEQPERLYKALIVVGTLFGLYALFQMRYLIMILFGAILFASTIRPMVSFLERRGLARSFSILLVYLVTILLVSAVIMVIVPSIVARFIELANSESQIIQTIQNVWQQVSALAASQFTISLPTITAKDLSDGLQRTREQVARQLLDVWPSIFQSISDWVLLLTMAFYWLTERDRIETLALRMIPSRQREPL